MFSGLILMGPFGSGKSYLGKQLHQRGIAYYQDLEPIVYDRFGQTSEFDAEGATAYLRAYYKKHLSEPSGLTAFESTGVVQRPLLLEMMNKYPIALIRVDTPKTVCLQRIAKRNKNAAHPVDLANADAFFDYWTNEIAVTYTFMLHVSGLETEQAIADIQQLLGHYQP